MRRRMRTVEHTDTQERKTPLYDEHVRLGGRIVPFGGYLLPVQYEGVIAEHLAVRNACGLFDVSHMGEVFFTGPDAYANLQHLLTNDMDGMTDGRVRYTTMCNEQGGVIDDFMVYRYGPEKYLAVVNASNRRKDVSWMKEHRFGDVEIADVSDEISLVALQGPKAREILLTLADAADIPEKYYTFKDDVAIGGIRCMISRTGYTGELGYEIYTANANAAALWNALLAAGAAFGLVPAGLGARDTLRLEAAMPLYGHEMDETVSPLEADLGFAVKLDKDDFIGKAALVAMGAPVRRRVGLQVTGRGIVRENETVYIGGDAVGRTTSGTHCPYLGRAVAMAMLQNDSAAPGTAVEVEVRGRRIPAEVVPLPFYKRAK